MTATLIKPSILLPEGLRLERTPTVMLFKFTEELGERMQVLLDKKKGVGLTPEEALELATIAELDEIFSYANASIASESDSNSS